MIRDLDEIENTVTNILNQRICEIGYEDDNDVIIQYCKDILEIPYEPDEEDEW